MQDLLLILLGHHLNELRWQAAAAGHRDAFPGLKTCQVWAVRPSHVQAITRPGYEGVLEPGCLGSQPDTSDKHCDLG